MNREIRDAFIQITSMWAQNCRKLDLTEITVSYDCIDGTVTIFRSTFLSPEKGFADVNREGARVCNLLRPLGLKTVPTGEYEFQYRIHSLEEIDTARKRACSSSVEAMRFINSIAIAVGKEHSATNRVVVRREVLVGNSWVDEGTALCAEALS